MSEVVTRLSDMNPDKRLQLIKDENSLKIKIEGWEDEWPRDRNHIQFCTHAWWGHSVNMVHSCWKLFNLLENADRLDAKKLEINNQLLEVLRTFDSDIILDFPLAWMDWEREITIPYDKIDEKKKEALNNLFNAAKKDQKEYPDNY